MPNITENLSELYQNEAPGILMRALWVAEKRTALIVVFFKAEEENVSQSYRGKYYSC